MVATAVWLVPLCLPAGLAGRDIYVDQSHSQASDASPGTELRPLKTIDRALVLARPGDHVYIKGSANRDSPAAVYDRSGRDGLPIQTPGTAGQKVVIEAFPGHTVILQGNGSRNGLALDHASYHEIRGLMFRNFNKAAEGFAVKSDILLEKCEFTQTRETGLRFRNVTNLTLRNLNVHHCFEAGIAILGSSNVRLERVQSNYNSDARGTSGDGDGIDINGSENVVCLNCTAIGNSEDGFDLNCNGVFINCIARNHAACNVKLWRRQQDDFAPKKMDFINCLFTGAREAGIKVSLAAELHLYNSVIYGNGEEGIAFRSRGVSVSPVHSTIVNTIIAKNGTYGVCVAGTNTNVVDADHNLYYQNGTANLGLHSDAVAIIGADPRLFGPASGYFQLRASSPAIDAGRIVPEVQDYFARYSDYFPSGYVQDFDGKRRPAGAAWDIGADERTTVVGDTPPTFSPMPQSLTGEFDVNEGDTLEIPFTASDAQGNTLVFFLSGGDLVDTMTIDTKSGKFSFTPTYEQGGNTAAPQRRYAVVVGVTDHWFAEPADQTTVRIVVHNVNRPPVYEGLDLYTLVEGRLWMLGIPAVDADGDKISYALQSAPAGMKFDGSTGRIAWTPAATEVGRHEVEAAFSDGAVRTRQRIVFEVQPRTSYQAPADTRNVFFVDAAHGSNTNSGRSESLAWKTIGRAASLLKPGQMVLIREGVYYEAVTCGSGGPGQPIIYKAYPGERPVLDGSRSGSSPKGFRAGSHLVFDGLTVRNYETALDLRASQEDIVIANCTIEDVRNYGVFAFTGDQLRIENVKLLRIGDRGVYGGGTNVHLFGLIVDTVADRGICLDGHSVDNVTLVNSEISGAGRLGALLGGRNAFVENTRIHDNKRLGVDLAAQRNFLVDSRIENTFPSGGFAVNLRFPTKGSSGWIFNSTITASARYGMYVNSDVTVYMKDSVVSGNHDQDIVAQDGASATDAGRMASGG